MFYTIWHNTPLINCIYKHMHIYTIQSLGEGFPVYYKSGVADH